MSFGHEVEPAWPQWGDHDPTHAIQRRSEIKVGSVVFTHDINRRVYYGGPRGNSHMSQRHHFRPEVVSGETRMSWLVGPSWHQSKFPKRGLSGLYGLADVEDSLWLNAYAHRIGEAVRRCRDAEKMRLIAEMVGFQP